MSSFSKMKRSAGIHVTDQRVYNRAELMRQQATGIEILWPPKPKPKPTPKKAQNPPTVNITNLNIIANEKDVKDENIEESTPINQSINEDDTEMKQDMKKVTIRHQQHWFVIKFKNENEFYEFLDHFQIFGLLADKDGCLIITHYDDLLGENNQYRTVKFTEFDRWKPYDVEAKSDKLKKFYSDVSSIKKKGICTKVEKTIGIRHNCVWLQLTFRYKWEFDKFLYESKCYAVVDEHTNLVVRSYDDLEQTDYRLFNVNAWDKYHEADADGTYSGSVEQANTNKVANKKKKAAKTSNVSTSWWSSSTK